MITCTTCLVEKDDTAFYFRPGGKRRTCCKTCSNVVAAAHQKKHKVRYNGYAAAYRARNPGKTAAATKRYMKRNPHMTEHNTLMKRVQQFGLTLDLYHAIAERQDFLCAVCGEEPKKVKSNRNSFDDFVIDHDHETGRYRALVCVTCNVALGMLRDSPVIARAAADYLEKHHARRATSAPSTSSSALVFPATTRQETVPGALTGWPHRQSGESAFGVSSKAA